MEQISWESHGDTCHAPVGSARAILDTDRIVQSMEKDTEPQPELMFASDYANLEIQRKMYLMLHRTRQWLLKMVELDADFPKVEIVDRASEIDKILDEASKIANKPEEKAGDT